MNETSNARPSVIEAKALNLVFRTAMVSMIRNSMMAEISAVVGFLAAGGAGYITGQNLRADGGLTRSV